MFQTNTNDTGKVNFLIFPKTLVMLLKKMFFGGKFLFFRKNQDKMYSQNVKILFFIKYTVDIDFGYSTININNERNEWKFQISIEENSFKADVQKYRDEILQINVMLQWEKFVQQLIHQ